MTCQCRQCWRDRPHGVADFVGMIVCDKCGNKRCPHATDHRYECTNSNSPGQVGSVYEAMGAALDMQPGQA